MKNIRFIIFVIFAVISVAAPLSIIWRHEAALKYGKAYKFRTAPVDPYDAFRGRYVVLRFADDFVTLSEQNTPRYGHGQLLYVRLRVDKEGFAIPDKASWEPLKGDDVITVDESYENSGTQHLEYPFDRYYLSEDEASQAEQLYRDANRRGDEKNQLQSYAVVRVRNGVGVLEDLYINGKPVHEALKEAKKK